MDASLAAFTPSEEDIKGDGVRRIYSNVGLDYDEEEILHKFHTFAAERNYRIPVWYS